MTAATPKISMGTDFTQGEVMPLLFKFFLPFLLANLLNSIYNTVDTIIIGQFVGSSGIVAVTMGGKMLNLFTNIGLAFAGGGQVLIAQLVGAKRRDELNATIGTLFSEMFGLSVIFAVVTLLLSRNIITWLNTPAEAFESAVVYLRITCVGLPLIFGYNAVSSVLRGMGDSKSPLIFIAIAAFINLIGDLIFIIAFHMGAAGTAIATVLGQGVSLLFSLSVLYRRREHFGFDFKFSSFRIDWPKLRVMLKLGYPVALRACCITITQLVLMSFVNLYGLTEATAYSIGDKIVHLANIFSMAAKQAAGSMVGQNIGADRHDRVKKIVRSAAVISVSTALVLGVVSIAFPRTVFGLFTRDAAVLEFAPAFMLIGALIFLLSAVMGPYEAVITGTGNAGLSLLGGLLDGVIFRISFSFFFARVCGMGVEGFFLGDALARFGPILVGGIYYYSGAWKRRKKLLS